VLTIFLNYGIIILIKEKKKEAANGVIGKVEKAPQLSKNLL